RLAHGDGYAGLEQAAPFHSIIVAAAAPRVPEGLARQLAAGGRMVLPLSAANGGQRLVLIERNGRGYRESGPGPGRFVPREAGKAVVARIEPRAIESRPLDAPPQKPQPKETSTEFMWPAKGKILAGFAEPRSKGIDIDGRPGDPIVAAAAGRVTYIGSGIPGL